MRYTWIGSLLLALLLLVFSACQDNKQVESGKDSILYEASELALVMRSMDEEFKSFKATLSEGNLPSDTMKNHHLMHTARPTNSLEIGEPFYRMAEAFSSQVKKMEEAETTGQYITAFNSSVDMCVTCHSQYCLGPIARIKKLKITSP